MGGADGKVQLIDIRDGRITARLSGFERDVQNLCWRRLSLPQPQHAQSANRSSDAPSWRRPAEASVPASDALPALASSMTATDRGAATAGGADVPPPPPPADVPLDAASESSDQSPSSTPVMAEAEPADSSVEVTASEWRDVLVASSRDAVVRVWITGCAVDAPLCKRKP